MHSLREKLGEQIPALREGLRELGKLHGDTVVAEVTVSQILGGMRGIQSFVCDTSVVDSDKGLSIRGIPIADLAHCLPEEAFHLLCTGELPSPAAIARLRQDMRERAQIPEFVWDVLKAMPADSHPMTMLSTAILVMERDSVFRRRYAEGMRKDGFWEVTLEDSVQLLAKLPGIAAGIYRLRMRQGPPIASDPSLDWGADYAHMLGLPDGEGNFARLIRLFLTLHCDHEGGNVSSLACHTVGSALSDPYYAVSAGLNGLAGPLHGLANQECLKFILGIRDRFHGVPTDDQLREYAWDTLRAGRVIPGYGHAVLRVTDPRFSALRLFGEQVCPQDEMFQIVERIFAIVPEVLREHGKAKNPWPNVDAVSGVLLYHFGLTQFDYYTVLFGVSRALGMCAQLIINRALGMPIIRPKSVSTEWIKAAVAQSRQAA